MADLLFGVQQAEALAKREVERFLREMESQLVDGLGDVGIGDRSLIGLGFAMLLQNAFNERLIELFPQLGTWKGAPMLIYQAGQGGGITIKG